MEREQVSSGAIKSAAGQYWSLIGAQRWRGANFDLEGEKN